LRLIGTLPKTVDASAFVDHLLALSIKSRADERESGSDLWIYNENHVATAREELAKFLSNPSDPLYQRDARKAAEAARRKERQLDKSYRKNFRDASDLWYPTARKRIVTISTVVICVVLFVLERSSVRNHFAIDDALLISSVWVDPNGHLHDFGLDLIRSGQVWRLVTPSFLHGNFMHILFNMWGFNLFGTLIELRRGSLRLAGLMLISAVASNLGQFMWMEHLDPGGLHLFLGMSGVLYALFGYVWMKGIYEPEQGMIVGQNNVMIMLLWLVACMTGAVGPIANAAHFVGLATGVALGVMRY
jgi:rhomboid protease GlpG